jgi:hypothetical protein
MTEDNGNLSIDFLVGFTIFLLGFIWVISMIPGMLIGLQAYSIDYDAVAYRTGVILTEDPGWPALPPWESYNDMQKYNVTRFGLAISRDRPDILSQDKVNRFFCTSVSNPAVGFSYPDDYHQRAIFGDYPYRFKISLLDLETLRTRTVGERLPQSYGYIRRAVKIKGSSNATINASLYRNTDPVLTHVYTIEVNNSYLLTNVTDLAYQIDPAREQTMINITNLDSMCSGITLTNVKIYKLDAGVYSNVPFPVSNYPYIDGSSVRLLAMPHAVTNNVTLRLTPDFFNQMKAQNAQIFIAMRFDLSSNCRFLNNTQALPDYDTLNGVLTYYDPVSKVKNVNTTPFEYDYNSSHVTQPKLRDALLEVAVWSGETGYAANSSIFSDDFDAAGPPAAGWSQTGIVNRWGATPHEGAASIQIRDNPGNITRTISTAGYSGITVSFDMGTQMSGAVFTNAEWSPDGGTTWNLLKRIIPGDPEDDNHLHPFSYALPASADNNPAFTFRFSLGGAANNGDKAYIDNVQIGGIAD